MFFLKELTKTLYKLDFNKTKLFYKRKLFMVGFDLITDIPTTNKTILLRCDFNVPLTDDGKIANDEKIVASLPTIKYLVKTGARVVIATHIGNPHGKFDQKLSTRVIYEYLNTHMMCDVYFCNDCIGEATKREIFRASYGDIVVLENLKFHIEEEKCDLNFARELSDGMNIYVNDCLSCSHLHYASILGVPILIRPTSGITLNNELCLLQSVLSERHTTAIIGGNNFLSKIDLLNNLLDRVDNLILVGEIANTFLQVLGNNVGKSIRDIECDEIVANLFDKAKKRGCRIILPIDVVVANEISSNSKTKVKLFNDISKNEIIVDIGEKTLSNIKNIVSSSKQVIWYGSACISEVMSFSKGNIELCKIIANETKKKIIRSVVGGKNVVATIYNKKMQNNFSFISKSNQAFLQLISGKMLVGLEILHRLSSSANR